MRSLITEPLGLYGWTKAEPVILAALLSEEPLLIVGPHGCAKSFVLERLAESLGMAFRLYNSSLINYDDLVGVPLPDASRTKLEYLASTESIWDAQVVFIDEISRTRPELQNKLFPIIYDRRVQGRPLKRLVYRWAAMNPPPTEEELESDDALYLVDYAKRHFSRAGKASVVCMSNDVAVMSGTRDSAMSPAISPATVRRHKRSRSIHFLFSPFISFTRLKPTAASTALILSPVTPPSMLRAM